MAAVLNLKLQTAKQLHPVVLEWFHEQVASIEQQLAIDGLTVDDVETFLSDGEKDEFRRYNNEIEMGLRECINPDAVCPGFLPCGSLGPIFLTVQLSSYGRIESTKSLLRKAYARKTATKPEAVKRREEAERRARAFEALHPPIAIAKKYLNRPGEYERFEMSISGAVDAYLGTGELYIYQEKASAYLRWLKAIEDRQREETRKQRAQSAADAYNQRLNKEIRELTARLHHTNTDLSSYFQATVQDRRYSGHSLECILTEKEKRDLDSILVSVINKQLLQLCSEDLGQFIVFPAKCYRHYYALPSVSYSFSGVRRLDFRFDVFAAACAEVWAKPAKRTFDGFEFSLPTMEEDDGLSLLKRPRFLGYYYSIARPEDFNARVFWMSIPLVLLKGLLNGEITPQGTTVSAASDEGVTYRVPRLDNEITIPNSFSNYLQAVGTVDKMVGMGIMTEKVAGIVKSELNELGQERVVPFSERGMQRQDTRKRKAYQLFDEGKRPGDPEVKALKIKPDTAYRYFQSWKKTRNCSDL